MWILLLALVIVNMFMLAYLLYFKDEMIKLRKGVNFLINLLYTDNKEYTNGQ